MGKRGLGGAPAAVVCRFSGGDGGNDGSGMVNVEVYGGIGRNVVSIATD